MDIKALIPTYSKTPGRTYNNKFTVFTPVFNCEQSIAKVHESLVNQTYKDFEWLIINDGSTDNSHEVIEQLIKNSPLNINYVNNVVNKHKLSCFIQGISLAKGELFLTFDGDDECYPNALDVFNTEYSNVSDELKDKVVAVTGLCEDQHGKRVGDLFPEDPYYSSTFKSQAIDGVVGEKWGFTKTDVLKDITVNNQLFNKGYIPESLIWNLIAKQGYITKYINKILRIYYVDIQGSISSSSINKVAFGASINYVARFNWFFKTHFFKSPMFFIKNLYHLLRISNHVSFKLNDYLKAIDSTIIKIAIIILWPTRKILK
ncbi:glycosyltransferase family 2 protein [Psychroserpens sp.]